MNSASKIFYGLSAFFVVMTVFYFVATGLVSDPGSRVGAGRLVVVPSPT